MIFLSIEKLIFAKCLLSDVDLVPLITSKLKHFVTIVAESCYPPLELVSILREKIMIFIELKKAAYMNHIEKKG